MSVVANVALNLDTRGVPQKLREVQNQAQQTERAVGSLGGAIGKLALSYAALRTAQEALQTGIRREESERRLTFLAKGYNEVAKAQELAARSGRQFGLSATESNQQFAQLYGRLRPLNVSLEDINAAFVGFNTAAKVSGATTAESAGALLQLTQALGSGVLRGQELNSVLEQAPGLVIALTKELGKPVSEIRKLAEEGKITSDVVIRALKRAGTEGADELNAALKGPAQQIKNLQNEFENFQVAATKDLLPSIIDGVRILTNTLKAIAPIVRGIGAVAGPVLNQLNNIIEGATGARGARIKQQALQQRGERKLGAAGVGRTYTDAQGNVYSTITGRLVQAATPKTTGSATGGFIGGSAESSSSKAADNAKRLKEELKRSLETGDQLGREYSRQVVQLDTISEAERKRNEIQFQYEDRARQINELKNAEQKVNLTALNNEIRRLEIIQLQREELKKQIEDFYSRIGLQTREFGRGQGAFRTDINLDPSAQASEAEKMKQKLDELIKAENQVKAGAEAIGTAFGSAFRDLIAGATSAEQAFAGLMQSIADHFLNMAAQIITQQITMIIYGTIMKALGIGGGGGLFSGAGPVSGAQAFGAGGPSFNPAAFGGAQLFAEGGFVTGPTRAVVGEAGNEYVIPASKMRGAMNRYAAGARGSAVIPAGDGGDGGTATMVAAPGAIDVRYTVERINSVDYVTADQFQQGMRQAAQQGAAQGEQRTLRRLQMSTSTRKRLGM